MNIISKEKKEIRWLGLPTNSIQEANSMESEKAERLERIKTKTKQLQDLILQQIAFKETYSFIKREYVVLIFCNYFISLCGKFCHFHIHFLCPENPQIIYTENHC